jgi:hypothetical protein
MDFRFNEGILTICDPECVEELYTTKNRFLEKHEKSKDLSYDLTRESILFSKTNKFWHQRR